jgi:predicted dehydrogenase
MTDTVRVAVIGLGYWGPNIVRNLHEISSAEVVSVCDLRRDRLDAIGRRYPAVERVMSYDDVLDDPDVQATVIATPVSTHYALARAALRSGKHVFVEKPLAGSVSDALDLIELANQRGLVLMPGHTFLYSPPVVLIKSFIDSGTLGDIYFVSTSRVNLGLHQADVSVVWDLGPHDFSILRYWLDATPTHVSAMSRGCVFPDTPDVAFINLEFPEPSLTVGHVELSWLAPSKLRRTTIVGSEKMVVYDDTAIEPVRIFDSGVQLKDPETFGEYRLTYRTGDIISPHVPAAEPLAVELEDFFASIQNGAAPRSSCQIGLDVMRIIAAVEESLAGGGSRVPVPSIAGVAA